MKKNLTIKIFLFILVLVILSGCYTWLDTQTEVTPPVYYSYDARYDYTQNHYLYRDYSPYYFQLLHPKPKHDFNKGPYIKPHANPIPPRNTISPPRKETVPNTNRTNGTTRRSRD